jgi:hypothetical protein
MASLNLVSCAEEDVRVRVKVRVRVRVRAKVREDEG